MTASDIQTVTEVTHWDDNLFSFRITRPNTLRFRSGEFVMIGLPDDNGKPLLRAYSIAAPFWAEELEFYSIKVANGPLTSRLRNIRPGDEIILRPKPVGTLVHDALLPGERLWLLATGTGFAPFASILRDVETYDRFDQIVVMHTCRHQSELAYGASVIAALPETALVDEVCAGRVLYYPTTTREPSAHMGRITETIASGQVFRDLDLPALDPARDRAMVCGGYDFNIDVKRLLEAHGLREGANSEPREFVVEKAFVGDGV